MQYGAVMTADEQVLLAVERAMVRLRRSMGRRALTNDLLAELARSGDLPLPAEPSSPSPAPAREGAEHVALFAVLDAVDEGPGGTGAVTVSGVAERMGLDASRASRLVAAAVASGHVTRVAAQEDGRRVGLELTAQGRALIDRIHHFRQQRFADVMSTWTPAERAEFARLLTRFTAPEPEA